MKLGPEDLSSGPYPWLSAAVLYPGLGREEVPDHPWSIWLPEPGVVLWNLDQLYILLAAVEAQAFGTASLRNGLEGHIASIALQVAAKHGAHWQVTSLVPVTACIGHHLVINTMHDEGIHRRIGTVDLDRVIKCTRDHGYSREGILGVAAQHRGKPAAVGHAHRVHAVAVNMVILVYRVENALDEADVLTIAGLGIRRCLPSCLLYTSDAADE